MFTWISSGRLGDGGGGVLAVVLQDGGNRAVEAGAEHQRPSAGGVSCGYPYRSQGAILALRLAEIWRKPAYLSKINLTFVPTRSK